MMMMTFCTKLSRKNASVSPRAKHPPPRKEEVKQIASIFVSEKKLSSFSSSFFQLFFPCLSKKFVLFLLMKIGIWFVDSFKRYNLPVLSFSFFPLFFLFFSVLVRFSEHKQMRFLASLNILVKLRSSRAEKCSLLLMLIWRERKSFSVCFCLSWKPFSLVATCWRCYLLLLLLMCSLCSL